MFLLLLALATPRYDIDVHITPATRSIVVQGTVELHGARELALRNELALTSTNATVERGKSDASITTRNVRGRLPGKLRFKASAANVTNADLLYVGDDVAFSTANERPWYPVAPGSGSTGDVRYHLPKGFVVAGPGRRIAPNAFRIDVPVNFWFAAGPYEVVHRGGASAYLLRARPRIDVYLSGIERVLRVLSREFGPYRYGRFMLVEVPESAAVAAGGFNAFGSAGGIVTRAGALDRPFNVAYYAHEIGHQWWSNLISLRHGETRGNYLMDEAMAQFASMRAVEAIDGPAAAQRYRLSGYPGFHDDLFCYCEEGFFRMAAAGLDRPLIEMPDDAISDRLSRNKGGLVWSMWADVVGRARFAAILRRFTREHAFREVTLNELVQAIERGAGRDFTWFTSQWLERTGAPEMTLTWSQKGSDLAITIEQKAPLYRVPVEVELRGLMQSKTVRIDAAQAVVHVPFKVLDVVLDPHDRVLRWTAELRAKAAASAPFLEARELVNGGKLAEAEALLRDALRTIPENDLYAARFLTEYRLADVLDREKKPDEARQHIQAALAAPTRREELMPAVLQRYESIMKAAP